MVTPLNMTVIDRAFLIQFVFYKHTKNKAQWRQELRRQLAKIIE